LLAYDVGTTQGFPSRDIGGKRYSARVFQKALFPLASGKLGVPSPQLSYSLPQSSSYFSREESHVVKAESTTLFVRPIPDEGRPANYTGAVGVLKAATHVDATTARVGDPLVLTLRVEGTGNIKLLPRPPLEVEWASTVAGTERLQLDTTGITVKGTKEFDWILTPTRDGEVSIPAIEYSYFNPYSEQFEVAEAPSFPISVSVGSLAVADDSNEAVVLLPLRNHVVGAVPKTPVDDPRLWILCAFLPIPALALLFVGRPRKRNEPPAIESLRTLMREQASARVAEKADISATPTSARAVRRLLLSSIARRLNATPDALNERARIERLMRRRGVTRETTRDVLTQLAILDAAAFSSVAESANHRSSSALPSTTAASAADIALLTAQSLALYDRLDLEALASANERVRKVKKVSRASAILLTGALASTAWQPARAQNAPANAWDAAVLAYHNRQFVVAADAFRRLSQQSPRDVDALANWATAAWATGDTVSAVVGWQRAARLDPLAADIREHMLLLPAGAREGIAEIPLLPVTALGYAGIVMWSAGWMLLAWVLWRRRRSGTISPPLRVVALSFVILGAGAGVVSLWGLRQLSAADLAVVVRPETIRSGPDADADALGGAASGDIVRIKQRQQLWLQVLHADGRQGWILADRLLPLAPNAAQ
ncbi:MAG: BatD family protein, partial [Gemmatimonadota bacterium]|nr:BatD family protein [Gemmatimonadota bacterium]